MPRDFPGDRTACCNRTLLVLWAINAPSWKSRAFAGQGDEDLGPLSLGRSNVNLAPMRFDNAPGNGHAQSRPFSLGGKEWLEDAAPLFGREAGAVVANGDAQRGPAAQTRFRHQDGDGHTLAAGRQGVFKNVA